MSVSIVMPAYNTERYIAQAIESVRAQTIGDWELIVVDDGSTDGTADIARGFAARDSRICLLRQANAGVSAARNAGVASASPSFEHLAFLDSDDIWEPDALAVLLDALRALPCAIGSHALGRYVDAEGRPTQVGVMEALCRSRRGVEGGRVVPWPADRPTGFAVMVVMNSLCIGTTLLCRSALPAGRLFDTSIGFAEDYQCWLRLSVRGDYAFADQVILNYRRHTGNASADMQNLHPEDFYVRREFLRWEGATEEQKRVARTGFRYWYSNWHRQSALWRLRWAWGFLARRRLLPAAKQLRHAARSYLHSRQTPPFE